MAKKPDVRSQWWAAQAGLRAALKDAGLETSLKALNDKNAFIASAEKHLQDERDIVFAHPNIEQRKKVIYWTRECERLMREANREELRDLQRQVGEDGKHIRDKSFWTIAISAPIAVTLAGNTFGLLAGVAVATFMVLLGIQIIHDADRAAVSFVEAAKESAASMRKHLIDLGDDDRSYSEKEEATGLRDTGIDPGAGWEGIGVIARGGTLEDAARAMTKPRS